MPVTKITLSTAMRARDVSRPHEEHLTEAAGREDTVARHVEAASPRPASAADQPSSTEPIPLPAPPRRRRRRGR